jgi:hypothetical protein
MSTLVTTGKICRRGPVASYETPVLGGFTESLMLRHLQTRTERRPRFGRLMTLLLGTPQRPDTINTEILRRERRELPGRRAELTAPRSR